MERYRTTLILLGLLLVVAVAYVFLRNNSASSPAATPTPTPQATVWQEQNEVASIDIISGTTTVSLRKDISTTVWSLISPVKDTADVFSVGSAADALKSLTAQSVLTGVTDLAQYELDKPILKVDVATAANPPSTHHLEVGTTTVDGSGYYATADNKAGTVYIVPNTVIEPLKSWIEKPPVAPPTPTPFPPTVTPQPGATGTITGTVTLEVGGTPSLTLPGTATAVITGSATITSTAPGAANPTTPLATPESTSTVSP